LIHITYFVMQFC